MVRKLLHLHELIVEKLEQEPNMSALVDALLAQHYGLSLPTDGPVGESRQEVLDRLAESNLVEITSDPQTNAGLPVPHLPLDESPEEPENPQALETLTPPPAEQTTPDDSPPIEPPKEVAPIPVPISPEIPQAPATVTEEPAPVSGEPPVNETPIPINVNGQPGGNCTIHGAFIGPVCIDCL